LGTIEPHLDWGDTCATFLRNLKAHPSKASSGYYYLTHLDYFQKIKNSIGLAATTLKEDGLAIFVVQDSYYKDIYNDLPKIITEISESQKLRLRRRDDFRISRTMAGLHPHSRNYEKPFGALEAVLCFQKLGASNGRGCERTSD
jgi:hypothetical protein